MNEYLFSTVFKQYMISQQKVWAHSSTCSVSFCGPCYAGGQTGLQDDAFDFNATKISSMI